MEIVITINEKDLMNHPDVVDVLKGLANQLSDKKVEKSTVPITQQKQEKQIAEQPSQEITTNENAEVVDNAPTYTLEDVRAEFAKVGKKLGAAAAKKILGDFGVNKVTELAAEQYADAITAAKAVM